MPLSKTSHDSSVVIINRTAIGSSGRLGSLYDGCQDLVLDQLKMNTKKPSSESKNAVSCEIIHGSSDKTRNLLQMIGIEPELRLNILLTSKPRTGIAALIDHPHPINEYTRFLYFTYVNQIEQLLDTTIESEDVLESLKQQTAATHIITGVSWGINIVVVLQLTPTAETLTAVDDILQKVRMFLKGEQNDVRFFLHDEELLDKNTTMNIYSNIFDLTKMTSMFNICQYLNGRNEQLNTYRPVNYFLTPIQCLYLQYIRLDVNFDPLPVTSTDNLEQYLIQLLDRTKRLAHSLHCIKAQLSCGELKEQLQKVEQQWIDLKNIYKNQIEKLKKLIIEIHGGHADISEITKTLDRLTQRPLNECIDALTLDINDLEAKRQLIISLRERHFEYCDVTELNVNKNDYEQILLAKLTANKKETRIICYDDPLNEKNQSKLNMLRDKWIEEYKTNPDLHFIYADFSYCSFKLPDMKILSSNKKNRDADTHNKYASSSTNDEIINVLLLGESGVGKSTFINAFVNYLTFKTLDQATSNKPVVLIPVSFFITTGDTFQERIIKFGVIDDFNNEDFNHPGQSVTQHCQSYMFTLNHINGKKLRIIDTPGFGDTRGLDQDDINMQLILKYINNLTHLNAICFLLKSDAIQLNNYFSTCITQLLDLLGPNAHQNIIFCFTNARPTFYTPGNTGSLLKAMLKSLPINDILFKKQNTFCFDNESFRYLVALKNEIQFNDDETKQFEMSWSTSVKESNCLLYYIHTQLRVCSLNSKRQSIKHAQIEITYMIRPILEGIRNILRNLILYEVGSSNKSIGLHPQAIHRPATKCLSCKVEPVRFGNFLIAIDDLHEIYNHCHHCSCNINEHKSIDYLLEYELLDRAPKYNRNQMNEMIRQLRTISNEFGQFLINVAHSTDEDPFLMGLIQMIIQEYQLCQNQRSNNLNLKLFENLQKLQCVYEENRNKQHSNLSTIYEYIQKIRTHPEVHAQLIAIQQGQEIFMKESVHLTTTS